jgi:hypothetical protein
MQIRTAFAALALLATSAHAGNIYQCKGKDGVPVFQNTPCKDPRAQVGHQTFHDDGSAGSTAQWKRDVDGFAQVHPDILIGSNLQLLQQAINGMAKPDMGDWELLQAAYDSARASAQWQQRSSPGPAPGQRRPGTGSRAHAGGIGASAYSRGAIVALKCTRPNGQVYYARGACGSSRVPVPGSRPSYTATDPRTGRVVASGLHDRGAEVFDTQAGRFREPEHLTWTLDSGAPAMRTVPDKGSRISADAACDGAQRYAANHDTARAQRAVSDLCGQGRAMYEVRPSRGSLYYSPAAGK